MSPRQPQRNREHARPRRQRWTRSPPGRAATCSTSTTSRRDEIETVMETTDAMKEVLGRDVPRVPALRGRTVVTLFYEASTRTRASFELAGKALGADVINVAAGGSSVEKGESLIDTVRTLQAVGADVLVMRHGVLRRAVPGGRGTSARQRRQRRRRLARPPDAGAARPLHDARAPRRRARQARRHRRRHRAQPRRALQHLGSLRARRRGRLSAPRRHCCRADCGPGGPPKRRAARRCPASSVETNLDRAIEGADVVMALRLQKERMTGGLLPSLREYATPLPGERAAAVARARTGALVMHPGPMNEGVEISPAVARSLQSVIEEQVTNGVAVRMAVLYLLAQGKTHDNSRHPRRPRHRPGQRHRRRRRRPHRRRPHRRRRPGRRQGRRRDDRRHRPRRRARLRRHPHPPARARLRAQGDDRDRHAGGGARRLHHRLRDAQHRAAHRLRAAPSSSSSAPPRRRATSASCRSAASRAAAPARSSPNWPSSPNAGAVAFSDDGTPVADAAPHAPRARVRRHAGHAHHRPLRGPGAGRGRRHARRLGLDPPRPARRPGRRRGDDGRARHRPRRESRRARPHRARQHRRLGRARPRGEGTRPPRHRRGHAAPPRAHPRGRPLGPRRKRPAASPTTPTPR